MGSPNGGRPGGSDPGDDQDANDPSALPSAVAAGEGTIARHRPQDGARAEHVAPDATAGSSRGRRTVALAVAGAVAAITVAVLAIVLLTGGDEPNNSADPTSTTTGNDSTGSTVAPEPPTAVDDLQVTRTADGTQALLDWTNPNPDDTQYYVLVEPVGPVGGETEGAEHSVVNGLDPAERYCFAVASFPGNDPGAGEKVDSNTICLPPLS